MDETEQVELRVVRWSNESDRYSLHKVYLKDGKPSSYADEALLSAPTIEDLKRIIAEATAATQKPVLSEVDDFPDQERVDLGWWR